MIRTNPKELGEAIRQNYISNVATAMQIIKENQPPLFHPITKRSFLSLNTCWFSCEDWMQLNLLSAEGGKPSFSV